MIQPLLHYGIHFIVPLIFAVLFFKNRWFISYLIMIATMLIDLDHLLATPVFDPTRCSINFHPLHSYYAIICYVILFCFKKTRILGLGLCIHILADWVDCLFM